MKVKNMNVTGSSITNTDRPEPGIRGQEATAKTVSANINTLSELKQSPSSSANIKRAETRTSEQKSETSGNQAKLTRKDVEEMVEALEAFANTVQTRLNFTIDEGKVDAFVSDCGACRMQLGHMSAVTALDPSQIIIESLNNAPGHIQTKKRSFL